METHEVMKWFAEGSGTRDFLLALLCKWTLGAVRKGGRHERRFLKEAPFVTDTMTLT